MMDKINTLDMVTVLAKVLLVVLIVVLIGLVVSVVMDGNITADKINFSVLWSSIMTMMVM